MNSPNPYPENEQPVSAWCNPQNLNVRLADCRDIVKPLCWYHHLLSASPTERNKLELMVDGVHWPDVDEDRSVRGVLSAWKAPGVKCRNRRPN